MKLSKYNFIIERDNCLLLYNCLSEKLTLLQPELYVLLMKEDIETLCVKHPTFYEYLKSEAYIVPKDKDEYADLIDIWKQLDCSETSFSVFVNPTLDCNMRCWYCYEKHNAQTSMSKNVFDAILKLFQTKAENKNLRYLNLGFFGGEPLMEFDRIVMPLIKQVETLCMQHDKLLGVSFVTNASLLTDERIEQLSNIKVDSPIAFQISIDGDRRYHNATKKVEQIQDSYGHTLHVIKQIVDYDMYVTIRFNATHYNIKSYYNTFADFDEIAKDKRKYVKFDIQHVWQDINCDQKIFRQHQMELRKALVDRGFSVSELKSIDPSRCYADRDNHVVVNYNGDLFKCTARDFAESNKEGILTEGGIVKWNEKFEKRKELRYGNDACKVCRIFPLCHGSCSQLKIENQDKNECIFGYSTKSKIEKIENRVDFLLESILKINENEKEFKS